MKIHFISNSLFTNSGFSKVTRYLASGLMQLGHDVSCTGLQTSQRIDYHYGIQCFPIDTGGHIDESTQLYLNLQKTRSDVLLFVDQMDADLNHLVKIWPKTLAYVPVEGRNIPDQMAKDLKYVIDNGGKIISQCHYGQNEMKKVGIEAEMIYHGYDPFIFYKMEKFRPYCYYKTSIGQINTDPVLLHQMECYDCRHTICTKCSNFREEIVCILRTVNGKWIEKEIGIGSLENEFKGKFLYLHVGQNIGLRKRQERLLKSYAMLINESRQLKDKTHLHLHSLPISIQGVDLIKEIKKLGIGDNVSFSYGTTGSSGWSEEGLNVLYNLADVNVSASSSEGFGLPTLESMACGIPQVAPNCSSFTELIGDSEKDSNVRGLLANIGEWSTIQDSSERALVNEQHLSAMMKKLYVDDSLRERLGKNGIKFAQNCAWDKITKEWDGLLKIVK